MHVFYVKCLFHINKMYILDYCVESTPRGRLKGALMYALEPATEESDASLEKTPIKRER